MSGRRAVLMAVVLTMASVFGLLGAGAARASAAPGASAAPAPAVSPTPAGGATQVTLPSGPGTGAPVATAPTRLSGRAKVAAVLGGLLLIGVLWAFSQGYGILGGHARRRRAPGPGAPADAP